MRRPDFHLAVFALEFGAAFADQILQGIGGSGDAERLHLVAGRPRHRGGVFLFGGETELLRQFGIERRNRRRGAVIGRREFALRRFTEAGPSGCTPTLALPRKRERGRRLRIRSVIFFAVTRRLPPGALSGSRGPRRAELALEVGRGRAEGPGARDRRVALGYILAGAARRCPRAVRGGLASGAAIPGIVRRRLQSGGRAHAALTAIDRGVEQFRQRRPDRLHVGPRCLGVQRFRFRGSAGFFRMIWILRHQANMG
jgi:hypothetical protein